MKKISEPIVFFGSGPVAAKSLELLAKDFDIEAVVTKPQPPHHKATFPVLKASQELGLKTLTVSDKAELSALFRQKPVQSRAGVVIDFGIIIGQDVIDYFPLRIVNSHFSLLPKWRGADPITFAILNGDTESGISLMLIVAALDEGPLLAQSKVALSPAIDARHLTDLLIELSNAALAEVLPKYMAGQVQPYPQDIETPAIYSRKLTKDDGVIDWAKPAAQIEREIRAFIEWPRSRTTIAGRDVIITKAHADTESKYEVVEPVPGKVFVTPDKHLAVQTGQDVLIIDRLKPAGKREMSAAEFLVGYHHLLR